MDWIYARDDYSIGRLQCQLYNRVERRVRRITPWGMAVGTRLQTGKSYCDTCHSDNMDTEATEIQALLQNGSVIRHRWTDDDRLQVVVDDRDRIDVFRILNPHLSVERTGWYGSDDDRMEFEIVAQGATELAASD